MKKWLVPAIISVFALSLFEMWVSPLSCERRRENGLILPV